MDQFLSFAPEIFFILCGIVCYDAAYRSLQNKQARLGTFLFWLLLGVIFMFGNVLPAEITGGLLCVMGLLTATKQVQMGSFQEAPVQERKEASKRLGNKIFIPAVTIGAIALLLSFVKINGKELNSAIMVGVACLVATILAVVICKPKMKDTREDTSKLLMQVGAASLLPQLLAALGSVFSKVGIGDLISNIFLQIVPSPNIVLGVIIYVLGMVIFTMIMGNGFTAFSVITAGIGVPFVIMQGGDPVIVGALGMTAGFCGTLMTPMAANFNIVPCALLDIKDKWAVIKAQVPMALILIVVHVILMLIWAF